jgi:hypothetical protein
MLNVDLRCNSVGDYPGPCSSKFQGFPTNHHFRFLLFQLLSQVNSHVLSGSLTHLNLILPFSFSVYPSQERRRTNTGSQGFSYFIRRGSWSTRSIPVDFDFCFPTLLIKFFMAWLSNPLIIRLFPYLDYHESVILQKTGLKDLILIIKSTYQGWYHSLESVSSNFTFCL